jgi:hypothetical protein
MTGAPLPAWPCGSELLRRELLLLLLLLTISEVV